LPEGVLLIGHKLDEALLRLPHNKEIIVEVTKAPSKEGCNDSVYSNPVVVKHNESEKRVVLTVSCFR